MGALTVNYAYTTENQVRASFWLLAFPRGKPARYFGKRQNELPVGIRMAFCDYVDALQKDGIISASLADSVTL